MNFRYIKSPGSGYDCRYSVWLGMEKLGYVYKRRRPLHNMDGRTIYRTTYADKWYAEIPGGHRLECDTRAEAAKRLANSRTASTGRVT